MICTRPRNGGEHGVVFARSRKVNPGNKIEVDMETVRLQVNGREYSVAPEHMGQTLMVWLRDVLELTGTKCGCKTGDCGSCKVLVDGDAVTSCTQSMKKMNGKTVLTIEGMGTPEKLHPIQQAFVEVGAVQCGFCTPGMVLTTKALLDRNPDPSRAEVAEALKGNLCRCTGYVKIMDAVQNAAKALRG